MINRIYLGKNTIAQIALGRSAEEEYKDNLSKISEVARLNCLNFSEFAYDFYCAVMISQRLSGNMGLLFTSRPKKEILRSFCIFWSLYRSFYVTAFMNRYFENFSHPDFAKAGTIPTEDLVLEPQPLPQFQGSMLNELRKLGMAAEIDDGTIYLREPISIMTAGSPLTPEQARILVKLDRKVVDFKINLECMWQGKGSKFIDLKK